MQWSKLKKAIEGFLAESVKDRVGLHSTRYGSGRSSIMVRAWITWDKEEVANFSTIKWMQECYWLAWQIRAINRCQDFRDPNQQEGYYAAYDQARRIMDQKGVFSRSDFHDSLMAYLELPIDEAMLSENPIIRAFSMLDRRLGKRRLRAIDEPVNPIVKTFYQLRCRAERLGSETE